MKQIEISMPEVAETTTTKPVITKKPKTETVPIKKLTKYIKNTAIVGVSKNDIRFVIQSYYQIQKYRISLAGQIRAINQSDDDDKEHELLDWLFSNMVQLEEEIKKAVKAYVEADIVGQWLLKIVGIGPIIAGGLLCYLDPNKAPSVSHYYSYAGLNDNNNPWLGKEQAKKVVHDHVSTKCTDQELMELALATNRHFTRVLEMATDDKGKRSRVRLVKEMSKPPYNTDLKKLCWKVGESFVKVSNKPNSLYGRIYRERKALEEAKNEVYAYASQAEHVLRTTNIGKDTEAYKWYSQGMLPPAHINSRAKRYAVKIFISHLYDEMYKAEFAKEPVRAYVFEHLGHVDLVAPEVPSLIAI